MRVFAGMIVLTQIITTLTGCNKANKIYPTTENLIEIESKRLKVLEAKDNESGVFIRIGESHTRKCEIQILGASIKNEISVNSIEHEDKIKAVCFWGNKAYSHTRSPFTNVALRIDETVTLDIQAFNSENKEYLAFTLVNAPIGK
ncbi:hypothetical protein [Microbulbifer sp. VAAF005]|uniref:hypothetical protein n=1 Tax=unclassified Microbulbifer TaxID=2619833 RepID=UPI0024AE0704|nr:hypothetical protein [Microbulbifer sp. VAAF005]WHI46822.1 hypothetical protein P0078_00150 [Microbulbifer sp. VAAF005]